MASRGHIPREGSRRNEMDEDLQHVFHVPIRRGIRYKLEELHHMVTQGYIPINETSQDETEEPPDVHSPQYKSTGDTARDEAGKMQNENNSLLRVLSVACDATELLMKRLASRKDSEITSHCRRLDTRLQGLRKFVAMNRYRFDHIPQDPTINQCFKRWLEAIEAGRVEPVDSGPHLMILLARLLSMTESMADLERSLWRWLSNPFRGAFLLERPEEGFQGLLQGFQHVHSILKQEMEDDRKKRALHCEISIPTAESQGMTIGKWNRLFKYLMLRKPIPEQHRRFSWTNRDGKRLYDDYIEHEPGALQALQKYLETTTVFQSAMTDGDHNSGPSSAAMRYTPGSGSLSHAQAGSSRYAPPAAEDITDHGIPSSDGQPATALENMHPNQQTPRPLYLLSCTERRGKPVKLHQEFVTNITDDRQLFHALRDIYYSDLTRFRSLWSLRTLDGIHFMKFIYAGKSYIDIRCHKDICNPGQTCLCIPPATLIPPLGSSYQYQPIPSKLSPPIGPRLMLDFFKDPNSRAPGSDLVLQQLPKKLDTELISDGLETIEAWGIFYREDWDWRRIWAILGLTFFPPSLLFGILWAVLREDIQGAFGVASWWMAAATIFIGILGTAV